MPKKPRITTICMFKVHHHGTTVVCTWLVDLNAGKARLVSFDRSKNTGAIDVKM